MFKKIKNVIKKIKRKPVVEKDIINPVEGKKDEIAQAKDNIDCSNEIHDVESSENVIDLNKYRQNKASDASWAERECINDKLHHKTKQSSDSSLSEPGSNLVRELVDLTGVSCLECKKSFSKYTKKSAVSEDKTYMYVCCTSCGAVMKFTYNNVLHKTTDTLREVSLAYYLFKEAGINPQEYSYMKDGRKHKFK